MKPYFKLLTLSCIASLCHGMASNSMYPSIQTRQSPSDKQEVTLDTLPTDVYGEICNQIIQTVGTPQIKNKADIPIIAKCLTHLSLTNKALYNTLNHPNFISNIRTHFTNRFNITPLDAMIRLKTPDVRQHLQTYKPEKQVAITILGIEHVLEDTVQEFLAHGHSIEIEKLEMSEPDKQEHTQQDILLTTQEYRKYYDICLLSPQGKQRYKCTLNGFIDILFDVFTQAICTKLSAKLIKLPNRKYINLRELKKDNLRNLLFLDNIYQEEKTYKEAKEKIGTHSVFSCCSGPCLYSIPTDGYHVPSLILAEDTLCKEDTLTSSRSAEHQLPTASLEAFIKWILSYNEHNRDFLNHIDKNIILKIEEYMILNFLDTQKLVEKITSGWHKESLTNNNNVMLKKSEEEYDLFVKDYDSSGSFYVLRLIAYKLNLSKKVLISDDRQFLKEHKQFLKHDEPYIWIKKDAFDEVVEKLQLNIEE